MTPAEQKETALKFIKAIDEGKVTELGPLLTDDFEFEVMARIPGMPSTIKRSELLGAFGQGMKKMFPSGLNMKIGTVICEGPHVAVQAESDTTVANGKHHNNRYHFYVLFRGDKIERFREYADSNHAREVFSS
jgi:uncharacterized protein